MTVMVQEETTGCGGPTLVDIPAITLNEQFLGWKTVSPDLVVLQNIVFEVFHVPTASAAQHIHCPSSL